MTLRLIELLKYWIKDHLKLICPNFNLITVNDRLSAAAHFYVLQGKDVVLVLKVGKTLMENILSKEDRPKHPQGLK